MFRLLMCSLVLLAASTSASAGTGYEVTSQKDGKSTTYKVNFGGGRRFEQHTAFDPSSKKFVYLSWPRGGQAPAPVAKIWDHSTGKTIELFKFPDAKHPLPVIPSMDAMKVCPMTGDPNFKSKAVLAYD